MSVLRALIGSLAIASAASAVAAKEPETSARALIGARAVDRRGAPLGRIVDLVFACKARGPAYAVLSFDPSLDQGDKLYTYPLGKLAAGHGPREMVMETQRQALLGERGAKLLSLAVRRYDANAFIPQPRCMLASELIGRRIDYRDGRRAGQVVDLVFSLDEGRLRYVMTEIAGKPYAVPLDALQVPRAPGRQVMLKAGALSGADG